MKYLFAVFAALNALLIIAIIISNIFRDSTGDIGPYLAYLFITFAAYCILDKLDNLKIKP